jgi:hypothetical protein
MGLAIVERNPFTYYSETENMHEPISGYKHTYNMGRIQK